MEDLSNRPSDQRHIDDESWRFGPDERRMMREAGYSVAVPHNTHGIPYYRQNISAEIKALIFMQKAPHHTEEEKSWYDRRFRKCTLPDGSEVDGNGDPWRRHLRG